MAAKPAKKTKRVKGADTCRIFWQGASYTMAFPTQLVRALQVSEKDKLVIYTQNGDLIIEKYVEGRVYPRGAMFTVARVIGAGAGKGKMYKQIGFTVPRTIADNIKDCVFKFPVIEKKEGSYFKLVFKKLKGKAKAQVPA